MGDMADYFEEQDEMRIEATGRNPYKPTPKQPDTDDEWLDEVFKHHSGMSPHTRQSAKAAILQHEADAVRAADTAGRIDELERLTDEQENSQDWERAHPGYSVELVQAVKIHARIAELQLIKEGKIQV